MKPARAVVLLNSRGKLDLLDPRPEAWTDEDLAIGLSRTYRWGGYSAWDLPLSVAQHSLAVLALRKSRGKLAPREALRELLHDAPEAFLGWDCILPLKPHLGEAFRALDARLQAAVDTRYELPAWTDDAYALHKHADTLAAANEARHVIGWSHEEIRSSLEITLDPLDSDPLPVPAGMRPWEPWPPRLAEQIFLDELRSLLALTARVDRITRLALAFSRLPSHARARCNASPTGDTLFTTLVWVEASDDSQIIEEAMVVDAERNEDGSFDFDAEFTVFTTDNDPAGELIRVNGANCHVEIL